MPTRHPTSPRVLRKRRYQLISVDRRLGAFRLGCWRESSIRAGIQCNSRNQPVPYTEISMVRVLVLYNPPEDAQAFERHYHEVHLPLAKTLPGFSSTPSAGT